jgi:excinuclease ABC subunit B
VIIVASVSALRAGQSADTAEASTWKPARSPANALLRDLVESQYERNDMELRSGTFRVRGDTLEIIPAYQDRIGYRITFFGDDVERIVEFDFLTGEIRRQMDTVAIYPAKHFIAAEDKLQQAIANIEQELKDRITDFKTNDKLIEAQASSSAPATIWRCCARWATAPASRTIPAISTGARRGRLPGR